MAVLERQLSPLSDKETVKVLKDFARKVIIELSKAGQSPGYNENLSTNAMQYFDSMFKSGRQGQDIDAKFENELHFAKGLNLSAHDQTRVRRIMDEELLAWNMELFHPLQPGTTVADPILKNIQSSGQRIDDDVRNGNITNLRAELFEFAQQMQGTVAFAMLKGGLAGGLNPVASSVIRDMLSGRQEITPASVYSGVNTTVRGKTFASTIPATVYSGIPSDLSVEDFIKRWGNAPAKMKQYRRMHDGATAEGKDHMLKVMDGRMSQMDGTSYRAWLGRLNEHFKKWSIDPEEVAIINDSSDYALAQVQPLMVVFEKPVAASNAQDTLKKMMGKTNPLESEPGTIRARMVQELDLAQRAKYPIIRNVIHCPTSDEQRLEIDLMPEGDVRYFVSVARRLKEKAK